MNIDDRLQAAIQLKIPDSGDPDLNEMINKSMRDDFALAALGAIMSIEAVHVDISSGKLTFSAVADGAYVIADSMMKARQK